MSTVHIGECKRKYNHVINCMCTQKTSAEVAETLKCLFKINLIILQRNLSGENLPLYAIHIPDGTSKTMPNFDAPVFKYSPFKWFSL